MSFSTSKAFFVCLWFVSSLTRRGMGLGNFSDKDCPWDTPNREHCPWLPCRSHVPNWKLGILAHRRAAVGSGFSVPRTIAPKYPSPMPAAKIIYVILIIIQLSNFRVYSCPKSMRNCNSACCFLLIFLTTKS